MSIAKRMPLPAFRSDPLYHSMRVLGLNLTGTTFAFAVRLYPDAPGDPLILVGTSASLGAPGTRIVATGTTNGEPWTDLEVLIAKADIAALPGADEAGADLQLAYDWQWSPLPGADGFYEAETTILYGPFIVKGSVNG